MSEKIITLDNLSTFKQKYDEEIAKRIPEGIKELNTQYVRITSLDTGIYKLTYSGTKYLYYYGTTSENKYTIATSTASCLLFVQRYSTTYWHWEYSYASGSIRKMVKGWTSASSGEVTTLLLPSTMGTSGQYLKTNGSSSSPTWASLYVPATAGTSGQFLKSSGNGAPVWADLYAPTTAGNSGQFLKSSGSGAPVWADPPATAYLPIYCHCGTGLTVSGLGDLTEGETTLGYKCKIKSITGNQPPKVYPTSATFCFWYGSIQTPVTHVDKQYQVCSVTDITFLVGANSYLAYMLKNTSSHELSFNDQDSFTICAPTSSQFSMTPPAYHAM